MTNKDELGLGERLRDLIGQYFDLGYAEGVAGRDADTMAGDAQAAWSEIDDALTSIIAERDGLREALKPFAALGEHAAWMEKPDDKGAWGFDDAMLTWGDFRMARKIFGEP